MVMPGGGWCWFSEAVMILLLCSLLVLPTVVDGFGLGVNSSRLKRQGVTVWYSRRLALNWDRVGLLSMTDGSSSSGDDVVDDFGEDLDTAGIVLEDLSWRVEKLRLEEQNTKRFLKARPVFLPYEECCKWVQAFGRWKTEDDWRDWIAMGEKRNAYIPVSASLARTSGESLKMRPIQSSHIDPPSCRFTNRVARTSTMDVLANGSVGNISY
jgi:hypothetical protein